MAGLLDFMNAMANSDGFARRPGGLGTHPGSEHAAGSLWNIPGLRDALMQQQMGQMPQQQAPQQQQMPMQSMSVYPGGNSLAAYMRRSGPLSRGMGFGF